LIKEKNSKRNTLSNLSLSKIRRKFFFVNKITIKNIVLKYHLQCLSILYCNLLYQIQRDLKRIFFSVLVKLIGKNEISFQIAKIRTMFINRVDSHKVMTTSSQDAHLQAAITHESCRV